MEKCVGRKGGLLRRGRVFHCIHQRLRRQNQTQTRNRGQNQPVGLAAPQGFPNERGSANLEWRSQDQRESTGMRPDSSMPARCRNRFCEFCDAHEVPPIACYISTKGGRHNGAKDGQSELGQFHHGGS